MGRRKKIDRWMDRQMEGGREGRKGRREGGWEGRKGNKQRNDQRPRAIIVHRIGITYF